MASFLQYDTMLRGQEGDSIDIGEACRAQINAARSIGDEPSLIALLVRIACVEIAMGGVERAMAQAELPPEELRAIQELLQREIDDPRLLWALRGERAGGMQMIEAIHSGKVPQPKLAGPKGGWREMLLDWLPGSGAINRASYLRGMNRIIAAAKLPVEEQMDEVARIADEHERSDAVLASLLPGCNKVVGAHARSQAKLRCAMVATAVERYRQEHLHWPQSLAALVDGGYIKAVPVDPFDGNSLRYCRFVDGVIVYSVGYDRTDNGGVIGTNPMVPGTDIGFRLWDVKSRRRPAE
jgi:hypothetical protein